MFENILQKLSKKMFDFVSGKEQFVKRDIKIGVEINSKKHMEKARELFKEDIQAKMRESFPSIRARYFKAIDEDFKALPKEDLDWIKQRSKIIFNDETLTEQKKVAQLYKDYVAKKTIDLHQRVYEDTLSIFKEEFGQFEEAKGLIENAEKALQEFKTEKEKIINEIISKEKDNALDLYTLRNAYEEPFVKLQDYHRRYYEAALRKDTKVSLTHSLLSYARTPFDKIGAIYDNMVALGHIPAVRSLRNIYKLYSLTPAIDSRVRKLRMSIERNKELINNKVRQYVENFNMQRIGLFEAEDGAIRADVKLAQELEMSVKEVEMAHKIIKLNRILKAFEYDVDFLKHKPSFLPTELEAISPDIENMTWQGRNLLADYTSRSIADYGINYWHAVPNEEHKQRIKEAIMSKYGYGEDEIEFYHSIRAMRTSSKFKVALKKGQDPLEKQVSDLLKDYSNRVSPVEELDAYLSSFVYQTTKNPIERELSYLENSIKLGTFYYDEKIAHSKKYNDLAEFMLEDLKNTIDAFFKKPIKSDNKIVKAFNTFVQSNIALALTSPYMLTANLMQVITNTLWTKGAKNVAKGYAKGVYVGFGKDYTKRAIDRIGSKLHPYQRYALEEYFFNYMPENIGLEFMVGSSRELGKELNEHFVKVINTLTLPFRWTDFTTRTVGITAATEKLMDVLKKHDELLQKNKKLWIDKMQKDLILDEFNNLDRLEIKEVLHRIATTTGKKQEDAIKELFRVYGEKSVNYEMYLYHLAGKPSMFIKLKQHPLLAMSLVFTSWPVYQARLLAGAFRAAAKGNTKPLENLIKLSATWMVASNILANVLANEYGDKNVAAKFFDYLVGRDPMLVPISGLYSFMYQERGGFLASQAAVPLYATVKTLDIFNDLLKNRKEKNAIDYMTQTLWGQIKRMPLIKYADTLEKKLSEF